MRRDVEKTAKELLVKKCFAVGVMIEEETFRKHIGAVFYLGHTLCQNEVHFVSASRASVFYVLAWIYFWK